MSYIHISGSLCAQHNLSLEAYFSHENYDSPLLFLYECSGPMTSTAIRPHPFSGKGVMQFAFFCDLDPFSQNEQLCVIQTALSHLDICTSVKRNRLYAGTYPCCATHIHMHSRTVCHCGSLFYASSPDSSGYLNLQAINKNLSRSYLFGAVKYAFELQYGKAFAYPFSQVCSLPI